MPASHRPPAAAVAPTFHRLSASPLWAEQRRYYERAGIDAWRTSAVPHHVTSNVAIATAYARIVHAFIRDTAQRGPVDVIELGSGSGRFAFLFLRALDALGPAPIRYVMTDIAASTIAWWRRHEALTPFVRAGRLIFARADAESIEQGLCDPRARRVVARSRGRRHERSSRERRASRLVVIANYVFSGLPHDAFVIRSGRPHDLLVALRHGNGAAGGRGAETGTRRRDRAEHGVSGDAAAVAFAWRSGGLAPAPYPEDDFNRVLRAITKRSAPEPVLFPIGALRTLRRITSLADEVLVLVADRGTEETAGAITIRQDLGVARHGALSFPVNFPLLRAWVSLQGGVALHSRARQPLLHLAGFAFGRRRAWPATRRAYAAAMRDGGPAAIYGMRRALATDREHVTPATLQTLMERAGPDPRVIAECARPLWKHLAAAGARRRRDVARAVLSAWPNYYHVDERDDVPFTLALLLYEVREYAAARTLFTASLRYHGDDAATWWNVGLCHVALGRVHAARAAFRRAHELAPGWNAAGLATLKAARASQLAR